MLTELPKAEINLTMTELQIITARCNGVSFGLIDYETAKTDIDKILLSGAAITGAPLPTTEFFADIISTEVYNFIKEFGYSDYTLYEVLLAMRLNAKCDIRLPNGTVWEMVTFFGNCFNVNFLSKVLYNYSLLRMGLNRKLENYLDKVL